jgi:hypothetical protein
LRHPSAGVGRPKLPTSGRIGSRPRRARAQIAATDRSSMSIATTSPWLAAISLYSPVFAPMSSVRRGRVPAIASAMNVRLAWRSALP